MYKKNRLISILLCSVLIAIYLGGCAGIKQKRKSPQQLYEEGMKKLEGERSLLFFHITDYEGAEGVFEEIKNRYSFTSFAPLAELRLADISFEKDEYAEAITEYNEFIKLHPNHKEVAYALYRLGLTYFNQIAGVDRDQIAAERGLSNFELLIEKFPASEYVEDASQKITVCKDMLSGNEFYVGKFYFKDKNYKGALKRFKRALERFPGYGPKEEAMLYLGKSYFAMGEKDMGKEIVEKFLRAFPESPLVAEAASLL